MEILVNRKTIRKSRRGLAPLRYEIEGEPQTLRELLLAMVREEVARYNEAQAADAQVACLSGIHPCVARADVQRAADH